MLSGKARAYPGEAIKSFITLAPGANPIKRYCPSLTTRPDKLERLFLSSLSTLVLHLWVRQGAYSMGMLHWDWPWPNWRGLRGTNTLAYSTSSLMTKKKKFYNIGNWFQCHKTFFSSSLTLWQDTRHGLSDTIQYLTQPRFEQENPRTIKTDFYILN